MTGQLERLLFALLDALRLVEKSEVRCCGVTPYQGYVLMRLLELGPVSMQSLAAKMNVAASTMSRNVDKLEAMGLAKRIRSAGDARVYQVALTQKGQKNAALVSAAWRDYFAVVARHLGPEGEQKAVMGLKVLLEGIRRAGSCCPDQNGEERLWQ